MTETKQNRSEAPPAREARRLDELLDEALDETFPASDPVAIGVDRASEPSPPKAR